MAAILPRKQAAPRSVTHGHGRSVRYVLLAREGLLDARTPGRALATGWRRPEIPLGVLAREELERSTRDLHRVARRALEDAAAIEVETDRRII